MQPRYPILLTRLPSVSECRSEQVLLFGAAAGKHWWHRLLQRPCCHAFLG
ncbi:unnamed protein product [Protopolystoma xenopodis]|uniref:Uncharacterized protein n=1 Tax=Protopolystoma xenopodis TaxID=117903 RepID=A0A448X9F1_9PLAT|nr:unnamed protein product [Protopolystoma xenopodis]